MNEKNLIIVITGETGSGKSYLERFILPSYPNIEIVSKYTTRNPRTDETGVMDVHAGLSREDIESMDYTYVNSLNGEAYGIKRTEIDEVLSNGKIPCVDFSNEQAYLKMLEDYPNSLLILKIIPYFDEESMKDTFDRQGREPLEFETRKQALKSPLTNWVYKYDNMREVVNPYFMRSIPESISKNIIAHRIEAIISDECRRDLGASLLDEDSKYMGLYHYLYYYSKNRPVDNAMSLSSKEMK